MQKHQHSLRTTLIKRFRRVFLVLLWLTAAVALLHWHWSGIQSYHHGRRWYWRTRKWVNAVLWQSPYEGQLPQQEQQNQHNNSTLEPEHNTTLKKILLYTKFWSSKDWFGGSNNALKSCPISACNVSFLDDEEEGEGGREKAVHEADAVVFHLLNLRQWTKQDAGEINKWRRGKDQKFVIFNMESAIGLSGRVDFDALNGFFNWTMSFRKDSDVYSPYGMVIEKEYDDDRSLDEMNSKSKSALWLVSNCKAKSEREKYVGELMRQGINVDVFGACGGKCDKKSCDNEIHKQYRFYLSFENSLCEDYVTEKFFKNLNRDIIPIVLGGADYTHIAPNHSYIDVNDFTSPAKLAEYLRHLEKDEEEYRSYFWWKNKYDVIPDHGWSKVGLCNLCAMLHNEEAMKTKTSYKSLWKWFSSKSREHAGKGNKNTCKDKGSLPWSKYDPYLPPATSSAMVSPHSSSSWLLRRSSGPSSSSMFVFLFVAIPVAAIILITIMAAARTVEDDNYYEEADNQT